MPFQISPRFVPNPNPGAPRYGPSSVIDVTYVTPTGQRFSFVSRDYRDLEPNLLQMLSRMPPQEARFARQSAMQSLGDSIDPMMYYLNPPPAAPAPAIPPPQRIPLIGVKRPRGGAKDISSISNPTTVFRLFKTYKGDDDATITISPRAGKKYMVKVDGRTIHFGSNMPDFTKHGDPTRRERYLKRALGIKGNWRQDKYSPNNLSVNLLW